MVCGRPPGLFGDRVGVAVNVLGLATVLIAWVVVVVGIVNQVVQWWRQWELRGHDLDFVEKVRPNVRRVK